MKKRLVLFVSVLVAPFLIGATSWAAGLVTTAPAPTTTLKPVLIPTVNPTPALPTGTTLPATVLPATVLPATQIQVAPQPAAPKAVSTALGSVYYSLAPAQQEYFRVFKGGLIYPGDATGVLTGTFTNPNVNSSSFDWFHGFGYKETVCVPNLTGGCVYKHTYGAIVNWDFNVNGPVSYTYTLPYKVEFSMPATVFAGQTIPLAPTFLWDQPLPAVTSTMNYKFSHVTSVWVDAPFDGMDDLTTSFTQYNNYANIGVGIPVLPLVPSITGNWDINFSPFNTGGGNFPEGTNANYTKLGGTGTLGTSGKTLFNTGPRTACVLADGATSAPAWKVGHEQFQLAVTVLGMIPPTIPIATALNTARQIGDFQLYTQLDGSIYRQDYVCVELSDLAYVTVPSIPTSGVWEFKDLPVTLKYRTYGVSTFGYPLGYTVTFDMRGIDPKTVLHDDLLYVPAGNGTSAWYENTGQFKISGKIPVVPRASIDPTLVYDATRTFGSTVQIASQQQLIRREPAGAKIATPLQTRNVVQTQRVVPFPKPTALRGTPQAGEYTVVLGAAAQARADQIVALLKRMGISAYVVATGSATAPVVTLGAFLSKAQAEQLAGMLKEICKVDGAVVQSVSGVTFRPLGDDDVRKLNIPL
jgi:hypothetical protein